MRVDRDKTRRQRTIVGELAAAVPPLQTPDGPRLVRMQPKAPLTRALRLRLLREEAAGALLHIPARPVRHRTAGAFTYRIFSTKMRRVVSCESSNERDYCEILDVNPDVEAFFEQPEEWLVGDGRTYGFRAFPDLRVHFVTGDWEIHEVKPRDRQRAVGERLGMLAEAASCEGIPYRVIGEDEIRREPRRSNVSMLRSSRVVEAPDAIRIAVDERLARGSAALGELAELAVRLGGDRRHVHRLFLDRAIDLDWESFPLGPDSEVRRATPRTVR